MDSLIRVVTLTSVAAYAVLLVFVRARRRRIRGGWLWLVVTIALALASAAIYLLPDYLLNYRLPRGYVAIVALALTLAAFGCLFLRDMSSPRQLRYWLAMNAVWLALLLALALATVPLMTGRPGWLLRLIDFPRFSGIAVVVGLLAVCAFLQVRAFHAVYAARLPEAANRALFWVLDMAVVMLGIALLVSATDAFVIAGLFILPVGIFSAAYAQTSHRVLDIPSELRASVRTLILVFVTAVLIYAALILVDRIEVITGRRMLVFASVALLAALVYVPVRQLAALAIRRLLRGALTDPAEATRLYGQEISGALELEPLVAAAVRALNQFLHVRRSCLLLVNAAGAETVELVVMPAPEGREMRGQLSKAGLLYRRFAVEGAPLAQFDLEFSPDFRTLPPGERGFFDSLRMGAYAPVRRENDLLGILACGPKLNDAPFYPSDLELLATMASQTGAALHNARLVADLRRLNAGLETAKMQMEKLDAVKTDFITIASHELRTPLTQVRGYTDILNSLNSDDMLDKDQLAEIAGSLTRASERMEELITAMLDVSQLDVNAMDLQFASTSLEIVVRAAIEPLMSALTRRKLHLTARGLRDLPPVQADTQRLVQAFRNVIQNAVKFTPDGGRIEISASFKGASAPGESDAILIAIADTGVGIGSEHLELIFQKFYRTTDPLYHSSGAYKFMGAGPGLGLTIAKGVIEGHGGRIWAESKGHSMETFPGTTFYVLLPVQPPEDARRVLPFTTHSAPTLPRHPTAP